MKRFHLSFRFAVVFGSLLLHVSLFAQQAVTYSSFAHLLDQQRVLVFTIGKDYAYLGLQAEEATVRPELETAVAQFETNHRELAASPMVTGPVEKSLAKILTIWNDFRWLATGAVSPEQASDLLKKADQLLLAITDAQRDAADTPMAKKMGYGTPAVDSLVQSTSQLAILAQSVAMHYAFCTWKVDNNACEVLVANETAFSEYLYQLLTNGTHEGAVAEHIGVIAKNWKTLKSLFATQDNISLTEIHKLASELTNHSGQLTTIYVQSAP